MHPYTSNRKNITTNYPPDPTLQNLNYLYPRYQHTRRKTEWMQPNYDYNILYSDRNQLFLRLEEEKLYNKRSMLIIEDLLEEKKKMELLESKEKNITVELEKVNKNIRDKILNKRGEGSASFRQERYKKLNFSPQTDKQKNSSKYYESVITKTSPPAPPTSSNKNKTKQQIMKKLFQTEQPQKQKVSTIIKSPHNNSVYVKGKERNRINTQVIPDYLEKEQQTQVDILKEQIRFLKEELNEKNKSIVDYKCEIVRLQKIQKIMGNMLKKQDSRTPTKTQQKLNKQNKPELKLDPRCINVLVINKKAPKHFSKSNCTLISVERQVQKTQQKVVEAIKEVSVQLIKDTIEAQAQTEFEISSPCLRRSEVRLQLSSNIIEISSKIRDSEVDFYSSEYPSINSKILENEKQNQESVTQIMIQDKFELGIEIEKYDQHCQTDRVQFKEQGCQTTQKYQQIIQQQYLQWLFQKDYQQIQKKKKSQTTQPTKI